MDHIVFVDKKKKPVFFEDPWKFMFEINRFVSLSLAFIFFNTIQTCWILALFVSFEIYSNAHKNGSFKFLIYSMRCVMIHEFIKMLKFDNFIVSFLELCSILVVCLDFYMYLDRDYLMEKVNWLKTVCQTHRDCEVVVLVCSMILQVFLPLNYLKLLYSIHLENDLYETIPGYNLTFVDGNDVLDLTTKHSIDAFAFSMISVSCFIESVYTFTFHHVLHLYVLIALLIENDQIKNLLEEEVFDKIKNFFSEDSIVWDVISIMRFYITKIVMQYKIEKFANSDAEPVVLSDDESTQTEEEHYYEEEHEHKEEDYYQEESEDEKLEKEELQQEESEEELQQQEELQQEQQQEELRQEESEQELQQEKQEELQQEQQEELQQEQQEESEEELQEESQEQSEEELQKEELNIQK